MPLRPRKCLMRSPTKTSTRCRSVFFSFDIFFIRDSFPSSAKLRSSCRRAKERQEDADGCIVEFFGKPPASSAAQLYKNRRRIELKAGRQSLSKQEIVYRREHPLLWSTDFSNERRVVCKPIQRGRPIYFCFQYYIHGQPDRAALWTIGLQTGLHCSIDNFAESTPRENTSNFTNISLACGNPEDIRPAEDDRQQPLRRARDLQFACLFV